MLFPLFEWFENTPIGTVVRQSLWAFPVIEAVHLLGLCLLGGALLLVDLRLLGLGLTNQSIPELAAHAHRWLVAAVILMAVTGTLLFLSEAIKCYYNPSFWVKMTTLPIALTFTFFVRGRVVRRGTLDVTWRTRLTAAVSIALWLTVAAAGRWIGFSA